MVNELFSKLKDHKLTISSAESITGGTFASTLVKVQGASEYLKGSFVCYTNEYKYNVLEVSKDIEIVSPEMAKELAINSRIKANSSISISFTGNASPKGIEGKQEGLTYIGISNGDITETYEYVSVANSREDIIIDTANEGIKLILKFIENNYK